MKHALNTRMSVAEQHWAATVLACEGYRATPTAEGTVAVLDPVHSNGHIVDYQQVILLRTADVFRFLNDRS